MNYFINKKILCVLIALVCGCLAWAEQNLALFYLEESAAPMVDLAVAELSNEPQLVLLERSEMAKLQQELLLSATAGDETPLPALMQNVGLFVVVRQKSMQAFDGQTGVRLLDTSVESADTLCDAIRIAAKKQRDFKDDVLCRISCLPTIAANLSPKDSERAKTLDELLLRRLTNLPQSVLLERRHLLLLLSEPNAKANKLTQQLFAGSVVMKTRISPATEGGMQVEISFYSPDGKHLLKTQKEVVTSEQDIATAVDDIMKRFSLPQLTDEDKKEEAQNFIYEAWFAIHQGLEQEAIAAASSAGALDDEYDAELCRIAAVAAQRNLAFRAYPSQTLIRTGLLNLQTALEASLRQDIFPLELRQAYQTLFRYSTRDFHRYFTEQEELARNLTSRGIAAFIQQIQPPNGTDKTSLVELSNYFFELASLVQVDWDVSYWEQFTLPVLQDFIEKSNQFLAQNDDNEELFFRANSVNIVRFYPETTPPEAYGVYERTFRTMASSNIMQYAVIGRFGLLKMALKENSLTDALNHHKDIGTPLDAFYADLIDCLETKVMCNSLGTLPSLVQSCIAGDPEHITQKLQLQELAIKRFGCMNLLGEHLIYGYDKWTRDTAQMVFDELEKRKELLSNDGDRIRLARCQDTLARKFHLKTKTTQETRSMVSDMSFDKALHPFKKQPYHWNLTVLGYEDGRILMMGNKEHENDIPYTQLIQINPETGAVKTLQEYRGVYGEECRQGLFGAITETDYIAIDGYMLYLFPKTLNTKLGVVNLSQYCKECCHSVALADNRLFFSFDGEFDNPGNLIEYNLKTQQTKTIASTIDQSVVWPMQGYEHPYAISKVVADEQGKRLLMLLHDKNKDQYRMQFTIRLWAYYWETDKWEAVSDYLPSLNQDISQGLDNAGRFWISCESGIGPLNSKGLWQPIVVFDNKGIADKIQPKPMFEGFDRLRVDYSNHLKPVPGLPVIQADRWGFQMLSERYFLSNDYLFDAEAMHFYRLPCELSNATLLNGRYLLALPKKEPYSENMMLLDLEEALTP